MGGVMEICNQASVEPGIKEQDNQELLEAYREIQREEVHPDFLADLEELEKTEAFSQFRENKVLMKHKDREEYYLGEWAGGIKKGQGLSYRQGEYFYFGTFGKAPKDSGYLKLYKQQLIVEGQFKGGQPEGECTIRDISSTITYKGLISEQKPSSGVFKVTNSVDAQLSYSLKLDDYPHTNAIIQYQNGSRYEGKVNTSSLVPEGLGKAVYSNGTSYEGGWGSGLYHGRGRFLWLDGSFYEGDYEAGVKTGKGKYRYNSGKTYEGGWLNGRQGGQGVLYSSDGLILKQGFWENGAFRGQRVAEEAVQAPGQDKEVKEQPREIRTSEIPVSEGKEEQKGAKEAQQEEELKPSD